MNPEESAISEVYSERNHYVLFYEYCLCPCVRRPRTLPLKNLYTDMTYITSKRRYFSLFLAEGTKIKSPQSPDFKVGNACK